MKKVLHVGCGEKKLDSLFPYFLDGTWSEVRLDLDPEVKPDIVASMSNMPMIASGSMSAVFSMHNLEHLHPAEGTAALREFWRVLGADGLAVICTPDLELAAKMIVAGRTHDTAYMSDCGPVTPIDMIYGGVHLTRDNHFMEHRNGFTAATMLRAIRDAGFKSYAATATRGNVAGIGVKKTLTNDEMKRLVLAVLPSARVE